MQSENSSNILQSDESHRISYTRLVEIQEEEEKKGSKKSPKMDVLQDQNHKLNPFLYKSSKPRQRRLLPNVHQTEELYELGKEDKAKNQLNYFPRPQMTQQKKEKADSTKKQQNNRCQVWLIPKSADRMKMVQSRVIREPLLKSIPQNQQEYKRSDSSQRSILESKILKQVKIQNIYQIKGEVKSNPAQSGTLKKSNKMIYQSVPNQLHIRAINDSQELSLEQSPEVIVNRQQLSDNLKLTLRFVPEVDKKSAILRQSPEGRSILSSLVTSKNTNLVQASRPPLTVQKKEVKPKVEQSGLNEGTIIMKKIENIGKLAVEIIQNRKRNRRKSNEQKFSDCNRQSTEKRDNLARALSEGHQQAKDYLCTGFLQLPELKYILTSQIWDQHLKMSRSVSEIELRVKKLLRFLKYDYHSLKIVSLSLQQAILKDSFIQFGVVFTPFSFYVGTYEECNGKFLKSQGLQVYPQHSAYSGHFQYETKWGYGSIAYLNLSSYSGMWVNDKFEGRGIFISAGGDVFRGEFSNGQKSGQGIEVFKNGDKYIGQFSKDNFEGKGLYKWQNGSSYKGTFKNGKFDGIGHWISPNKDEYQGEFKNGLKQGWGVYKWMSGRKYEGRFQKGKRCKDGREKQQWPCLKKCRSDLRDDAGIYIKSEYFHCKGMKEQLREKDPCEYRWKKEANYPRNSTNLKVIFNS